MKFRTLLILASITLAMCGCRVRDVRTATLVIPDIRTPERLALAERALATLPDTRLSNDPKNMEKCMKIVDADFASGKIVVRYDSMQVGTKNLEETLSRIGFNTPTFPANSERRAKLPPAPPFAGQ